MWKFIARTVFYIVALVTLAWTASLTYTFVSDALPNMGVIVPAFALIVFDGGMLAWLIVYLHYAEGAGQRGVSMFATVFDLLGVGLMAIAEIFLGGQTMVTAPEALADWALWGIGIWTVANVGFVVLFHLLSPKARREMALRDAQDHIEEQAFEQLKAKTSEIAARVAHRLSDEMVSDAIRQLTAATPGGANVTAQAPGAGLYPAAMTSQHSYNADAQDVPSLAEPVTANGTRRKARAESQHSPK